MKDNLELNKYIQSFPEEVKNRLKQLRKVILDIAPESDMSITYGISTFKINGRNLVHFGGFKNHIGFTLLLLRLRNLRIN